MVEEKVRSTFKCEICGKEYEEEHNAILCERDCTSKAVILEKSIKAGTYYYIPDENKLMRIKMVRQGKIFYEYIQGRRNTLERGSWSMVLIPETVDSFVEMEKITKEQIPDKVDEIYRNMKDAFIAGTFTGWDK